MRESRELTVTLIRDIHTRMVAVQDNPKAMLEIGQVIHRRVGPPCNVPVPILLVGLAINELDEMHEAVQKISSKYLNS